LVRKKVQTYCRFARGDKYICPYEPEELTVSFCMCCKLREITSQQNLLIRQNRAVILLLEQIRNLLQKSIVDMEPPETLMPEINYEEASEETRE